MMKTKVLFCWIVVLLGFLVGCNAYEEGPAISLRSKEQRVIGRKKIELYQVNGIDSTAYLVAAYANTTYDSTGFEWLGESELSQIACTDGCFTGFWEFRNENKEMFIRLPSLDPAGFSFPEGVWAILRLSERDFWIQINSNGKTYLIKFVKID